MRPCCAALEALKLLLCQSRNLRWRPTYMRHTQMAFCTHTAAAQIHMTVIFVCYCATRSILYAWCFKWKLSFSRLLCALCYQIASACLTLGMYNEHTFASHNALLKCENTRLRAHSCEFIAHGAPCMLNSAVYDSTLCLFTVFSQNLKVSKCLFTMNTESCF